MHHAYEEAYPCLISSGGLPEHQNRLLLANQSRTRFETRLWIVQGSTVYRKSPIAYITVVSYLQETIIMCTRTPDSLEVCVPWTRSLPKEDSVKPL